jgi:hypothetical protein
MNYVAIFFAGALLCNSIPHLTTGLQGAPFPTPFSKPPGKGDSSPVVNFLWGAFNFIASLCLLSHYPVVVGFNPTFYTVLAGALPIGIQCSLHFGKVRRDKSKSGQK